MPKKNMSCMNVVEIGLKDSPSALNKSSKSKMDNDE